MSRPICDSVLPSGSVESPSDRTCSPPSKVPSRTHSPDDYSYIYNYNRSSQAASSSTLPRSNFHNRHHRHPLSPPKTRSASSENGNTELTDAWRLYTQKLRMQYEGEKTNMAADRARMEAVHAAERELWQKERSIMKARIDELEQEIRQGRENGTQPELTEQKLNSSLARYMPSDVVHSEPVTASAPNSPPVVPGNIDGVSSHAPIMAPSASRRSYASSGSSNLRLGDMRTTGNDVFIVSAKQLTAADFVRSPSDELPAIPENPTESVDISLIQPDLDGVPIKASALSPAFAARILSPHSTPSSRSPTDTLSKVGLQLDSHTSGNNGKDISLKIAAIVDQSVDQRLIMHAGHTPNHSISKFGLTKDEAQTGDLTPLQIGLPTSSVAQTDGLDEQPIEDLAILAAEDDSPLKGPLSLTNDPDRDALLLKELNSKLEDVRKSQSNSPTRDHVGMGHAALSPRHDNGEDPEYDIPLRLKPSMNFGRPMGKF